MIDPLEWSVGVAVVGGDELCEFGVPTFALDGHAKFYKQTHVTEIESAAKRTRSLNP